MRKYFLIGFFFASLTFMAMAAEKEIHTKIEDYDFSSEEEAIVDVEIERIKAHINKNGSIDDVSNFPIGDFAFHIKLEEK